MGFEEWQGSADTLQRDIAARLEPDVDTARPVPRLLAHYDLTGLGERRDPCGQVHGAAVDVPVLFDDGPSVDADVRRGQGNGWSALDHVEARKDSSRPDRGTGTFLRLRAIG